MNSFQLSCWNRCELVLKKAGLHYLQPQRVDGRRESYFVVGFQVAEDTVELFLYADEAGVMTNGRDWKIFEKPDYKSAEALAAAYEKHVSEMTLAAPEN